MVKYLKKSKIRQLLLDLGYQVPALKDCSYKFYRGSEWLEGSLPCGESDCSVFFKCYLCPGYMSVDVYLYDWNTDEEELLERKFINGTEYSKLLRRLEK